MDRIIFLDFDGVMVSYDSEWDRELNCHAFSPDCVNVLNEIIRHSNAQIVISSSWRYGWTLAELNERMRTFGVIQNAIDITPAKPSSTRYHEIHLWLKNNPQIKHFVVLDDDEEARWFEARWIHTRLRDGLQPEHVEEALSIFERSESGEILEHDLG